MTSCMEEESIWAKLHSAEWVKPAQHAMFHHCPSCNKVESSQRGTFQRRDMDLKIKCSFCCKSNPVKTWKCQCGSQWHTCVQHRGGYLMNSCMSTGEFPLTGQPLKGQLPRIPTTGKRVTDRPKGEVVESKKARVPARKGHKRTCVILDDAQGRSKKPTLLGPVLKGRFDGGSCSSACTACNS